MKIYNPNLQLIGGFVPEDVNSHIFEITPEMFIGSDVSKINQAISFVNTRGYGNVVCNGSYVLDSAILMKSNVTLIINGLIKNAVGMRDNSIRAASLTVGTPINNFKIKGSGTIQSSVDAWSYPPSDVGSSHWKMITILLANATNFEIEGITIKIPNFWSINLEQSRFGSVRNIKFDCDGSKPNQDGLNIRHGSHHILVDNLSGVTHDDTLALTNLLLGNEINYLGQTIYETGKLNFDIYSVVVKNINRSKSAGTIGSFTPPVKKGGITILCEDGLKIYDVNIDGVNGDSQIYIQFTDISYWVTTQATVNDVYNINISNLNEAPVYFGRPIKNSSFISVPDKDVTGVYNSVSFRTGCLNVLRKYHSGNFEFFATV